MWYAKQRKKRVLPVKVVDYFNGWEDDMTIMKLLEREYDLHYTEEPNLVFCHQFDCEHHNYVCPKIFCAGEPWGFDSGDYDLSISFEYEETDNAIRFPTYGYYYPDTTLCKNVTHDTAFDVLAKKTKFCNFVYSNGGPQQRIEFMQKLSEYKPVDCCGGVMNNTGVYVSGRHSGPEKIAFLSDYKFTIAFENTVKIGYTSEKICGPMTARSIPVYYGNQEIYRDFNPKSFVNVHEYESFDAAISRIVELDQNDAFYIEMLTQPWFYGNIPTTYADTNLLVLKLIRWIERRHLSLEP